MLRRQLARRSRPEDARRLAEEKAIAAWLVDLTPFTLVEQSREERPSGRVDHTFTYERSAPTLNEGRYRLRLVVSGDRLTEVTHFLRIPQAFSRRYEEMRSANEAIGAAGSVAMVVLYVAGGIGVGLFWLLRHRWVVGKPAIVWGVGIAGLQLLAGINELPLHWMSYDTALPRAASYRSMVTSLLAAFAGFATLFSFSFLAAEGLTRRAFGSHPQLWHLWSRDAAASPAILGRTAAGYLLVTVFFAYDVVLYLYATRWFGWWTPSEALIHPDILATYLPWLSAIANSLQAGFWEETLFRAVPIAGAALIGDRFGKRGLFIIAAFIVQSLVFGAGHAPYPTQPSYARPVELILPSIGFGLIYLYFGLLPGIVLHYAFDVIWMAMPLFVSSASGIWIDRTIVIALTLVPLSLVLATRWRVGAWRPLPAALRNAAWAPSPPPAPASWTTTEKAATPVGAGLVRTWTLVGVAALIVWLVVQPYRPPVPDLRIPRAEAARVAREALAARGITLSDAWRVMPIVDNGRGAAHEFVWEVAGQERFESLLGRYLPTPRWRVRVATFEGDVASRAEEWAVFVNHRGEVERITHQLPESRAGASLSEEDARRHAIEAVHQSLQLPAASLRDVSAQPARLTARTDWTFVFQDQTVEPIEMSAGSAADEGADIGRGEARIEVVIAGDEVARVRPYLRVPEAWQRQQRARDTFAQIVGVFSTVIAGGALVSAAVAGVIAWSRRRAFARGVMTITFLAFSLVSLMALANRIPSTIATMSTAQPFALQFAMLTGVGLIGVLFPSAMVALAAGTLPHDMPRRRIMTTGQAWLLGISLGLALGAAAAITRLAGEPAWPDLTALSAYIPLLAAVVDRLPGFLLRTITLLALLTAVDDFSHGWTQRRPLYGSVLVLAGAALGVPVGSLTLAEWAPAAAAAGVALLCAYVLLLRFDLSLTPLAVCAMSLPAQLRELSQGGPFIGSILGIVCLALTAWWLYDLLRRARDRAAEMTG